MKLKKNKITILKEKRFNPHKLWMTLCISFVSLVILELVGFSWYFLKTSQKLDAPVTANLETNAVDIKLMQRQLDQAEKAIEERAGIVIE